MHPRPRRIVQLAALSPALLLSCFDFDATMAGGPLTDAGSEASTAGLDASVADATLGDAGGAIDAGEGEAGDAGASADGGGAREAGPYCASIAHDAGLFFCDDFDESLLPGPWDTFGETAGSMVETDASAVSSPNSVDETTQPLSNGQIINVALRAAQPLPVLPATLLFHFALEPVRIDTTASAAIVLGAVDFLDGAGNRYTVGLAINVAGGLPALALGEQTGVVDGGSLPDGAPPVFVNHPLPPSLPLVMNAWSDLVVEIDWTAAGLVGKVIVNGNPELSTPLTLTVVPTSLQIGIGTSFATEYATGLSPVWELRYDDVLFTAR